MLPAGLSCRPDDELRGLRGLRGSRRTQRAKSVRDSFPTKGCKHACNPPQPPQRRGPGRLRARRRWRDCCVAITLGVLDVPDRRGDQLNWHCDRDGKRAPVAPTTLHAPCDTPQGGARRKSSGLQTRSTTMQPRVNLRTATSIDHKHRACGVTAIAMFNAASELMTDNVCKSDHARIPKGALDAEPVAHLTKRLAAAAHDISCQLVVAQLTVQRHLAAVERLRAPRQNDSDEKLSRRAEVVADAREHLRSIAAKLRRARATVDELATVEPRARAPARTAPRKTTSAATRRINVSAATRPPHQSQP